MIASDFGASVPMILLLVDRTVLFALAIILIVVDLVIALDVVSAIAFLLREALLVAG